MKNTNMVGMTNDEVLREADRNAAGCLVASLFGAALLAIAAGAALFDPIGWPVIGQKGIK